MGKSSDVEVRSGSGASVESTVSGARVVLELLTCEVCQHEIPASEAVVAEAVDYTLYFCGLDCYERWRQRSGL